MLRFLHRLCEGDGQRLRWTGLLALGLGCCFSNACSFDDGGTAEPATGGVFSYANGGAPPASLRIEFQKISQKSPGAGTDFAFLPAASGEPLRLLMTLREAKLALLTLEQGRARIEHTWSIAENETTVDACGLTNIAIDPQFTSNGYIYLTYCTDPLTNRLVRYDFSDETGPTQPSTIVETQLEENIEIWHRFGSIGWEDDEVMWMFVGDHFHREFAQDPSVLMGSVARIIPNRQSDGAGYVPAPGNLRERLSQGELAELGLDAQQVHPALYAYGFRSPWRGSRDSHGRFWVGDVGLTAFEEVDLVTAAGQNFGWDRSEGPCQEDCADQQEPLTYYDRDNEHHYITDEAEATPNELRAIWVGQIYEQPSQDRYAGMMDGVVAFGDLFSGFVRGLRVDASGKLEFDEPIGALPYVTQWKVGPDGYIYVLDLSGNLHVALLDYE